jgi:hypothetical protein
LPLFINSSSLPEILEECAHIFLVPSRMNYDVAV